MKRYSAANTWRIVAVSDARTAASRRSFTISTACSSAFGFAAEYCLITATGAVRPRDEVLRYYGAKEVAWRVYRTDSIRVRLFGDAAVVTAVGVREGGWVAGPRAGTDLSGRYRSTRVYVRRGGRWQLVSTHESRIAP